MADGEAQVMNVNILHGVEEIYYSSKLRFIAIDIFSFLGSEVKKPDYYAEGGAGRLNVYVLLAGIIVFS